MTETLYIRLGSQSQDIIHWLIYAEQNREIIASGELTGASELKQLTEKAQTRTVITFVPSCDVSLKQLKVPGNSQRAIRMAAPYMLEDFLAQDVEQLFFAYANLKNPENDNNCFVAVVERAQLELWKTWLSEAQLLCKVMIPDVLALPLTNESWSAVTLGEQLLIRQSNWQGLVLDAGLWPVIESNLASHSITDTEQQDEKRRINSYSPLSAEHFAINAMPEELPLALLAEHAGEQKFNLLQGEYQVKQTRSPILANWLSVAALLLIALTFTVSIKVIKLQQLNSAQEQVANKIVTLYKKTFPKSKRVKVGTVRSQLKRKLAEYGGSSNQSGFLAMLAKVRPAFAAVPQLKPESLKFDSKRQELRLQAIASDYQYFEKFKIALEKAKLKVNQGSLNNQDQQVSGSFSIKG
jgi:general secretion pathway protein L